jgi:hypothetical protein
MTRRHCRRRLCPQLPRRPSTVLIQRQGPIRQPPPQLHPPRSVGVEDRHVLGPARLRKTRNSPLLGHMHTSLQYTSAEQVRVLVVLCGMALTFHL